MGIRCVNWHRVNRGGVWYPHAVRSRGRFACSCLLALVGCGDVQTTDSRFATPERTVHTLLASHGMSEMSQQDIRERIGEHGAFQLRDTEAWRSCFADFEQPAGEGMAGYVLGILAAGRDELRYETVGDIATVRLQEERVVMRRGDDGAYRIVLRDSVPERVRAGLLQIEENARRRTAPGP